MNPIRICIVDDHPVVREGLRSLLAQQAGIEIAGEAGNGAELFDSLDTTRPEVVLLDIRLPDQNGLEVLARLKNDRPAIKVIILTTYEEDEYLFAALRAGADGYLLKSASPDFLAAAIRQVAAGERLLMPSLVTRVMHGFQELARTQARAEAGLTGQELDVLRLIAAGATNREIAEKVYWSEITVKRKVQDILEKLGAANRAQAVAAAARRGLL